MKNHKSPKIHLFRKSRGLGFKLERMLLIMQLNRYFVYKVFQEILKYAKRHELSIENPYIQVNLKNVFKNVSLEPYLDRKTLITPELIENAFQKLDIFIEECQTALEKARDFLK